MWRQLEANSHLSPYNLHYFTHQVSKSNKFERDGFDIHSNVTISFTQAALGGEVKTPGLKGPIMLKVNIMPDLLEPLNTDALRSG